MTWKVPEECLTPRLRPMFHGLTMRCKVVGIARRIDQIATLAANVWRLQMPCDSEIDLVLINCFTPSLYQHTNNPYDEPRVSAKGNAAYKAACRLIFNAGTWLNVSIPVPKYDREWFPHLKPNSTQAGWLWLNETRTLNAELVLAGHALESEPKGPW